MMAVSGSPATSIRPGSSDPIPVTFVTKNTPYIQDFGRDYCLENRFFPTVTPSYHALDVRGPSSEYTDQVNKYGLVNLKITSARLSSYGGPTYADILVNGLQYKIQVGQSVSVPRIVLDVINASNYLGAVIVP